MMESFKHLQTDPPTVSASDVANTEVIMFGAYDGAPGPLDELVQRELNHRFYNSLQLISSTLDSLARYPASPDRGPQMLRRLQSRVLMLAKMHQLLSASYSDTDDLASTCGTLCELLAGAYGVPRVQLRERIAPPPMTPTMARGMMLILVELLTNAIKHGAEGETIELEIDAPCAAVCRVRARNRNRKSRTRAMPLIADQVAQSLGGTLDILIDDAFEAVVTLPTERPQRH
jgi:signal transduction histidine kinase